LPVRRFLFGLASGIVVITILLSNKALGAVIIACVFTIACGEILALTRPVLRRSVRNSLLAIMSAGFIVVSYLAVKEAAGNLGLSDHGLAYGAGLTLKGVSGDVPSNLASPLIAVFYAWCAVFLATTLTLVMEFRTGSFQSNSMHFILSLYTFILLGLTSFLILYVTLPHELWFCVCLLSWGADAGALFTGRTIGRIPLCPKVSPKKTVEGFAGAVITGAVAIVVFIWATNKYEHANIAYPPFFVLAVLLLGGLVAAISHIGDLFMSVMKRECDQKESGFLIPEHGGALDKIDSFSVASILMLALVMVTG